MGFHHVALATRDAAATHDFYTRVMGFRLAKVVTAASPGEQGGWSKHFFYETSDGAAGDHGMIAFWEIHDPAVGDDYDDNLNRAAGLPGWANHIAFDAPSREALDSHRERWQSCGYRVLEIDHDFCVSIYITDPSGNMVEFSHTLREFSDDERAHAVELLNDPNPPLDKRFRATMWEPA